MAVGGDGVNMRSSRNLSFLGSHKCFLVWIWVWTENNIESLVTWGVAKEFSEQLVMHPETKLWH